MQYLIPKRKQFNNWSLPSKLTFYGVIIGIPLAVIFYLNPRSAPIADDDIKKIANMIAVKTIVTSPLCCEINTTEVIAVLPLEGEMEVSAISFIDGIPTERGEDLVFSFSEDPFDSIMVFNCNHVQRNLFDIFYYENNELICKKEAVFDLRDPDKFCDIINKK